MDQSTDALTRLEAKLDGLAADVATLRAASDRRGNLYDSMTPLATKALGVAAERLDDLEKRGYFDMGRELLHVIDSVVAGYTPDDVHQLADNVVTIFDMVKRATQPEVLQLANRAAEAAEHAGEGEPPGVMGLLRATSNDEEVRRGMVVLMAVLREIGRAVHPTDDSKALARISPLLGGKRNLGPAPEARAAVRPAPSPRPAPAPRRAAPAAAPAPAPAVTEIDGVRFTAEGFIEDPAQWTRELAATIAAQAGVGELTERHWKVLDFARGEFESTGASPNVRRLTSGSGVPTKDLYQLFPRAPAKTAARIAGIPKPVGCL